MLLTYNRRDKYEKDALIHIPVPKNNSSVLSSII